MPKMIKTTFDKKLTTPSSNREETAAFLADNPSVYTLPNYALFDGYELLASRPLFEDEGVKQTICLTYGNETIYKVKTFVRNSPNAYMTEKNLTQLIVWRASGHDPAVISGFARMMFNHLLESYNIVISDEHQSEDGKRFWLDRLSESFRIHDRKVYYIDLNDLNDDMTPLIIEIENDDELKEIYIPLGWGTEVEFKDRAFVISKKWPL